MFRRSIESLDMQILKCGVFISLALCSSYPLIDLLLALPFVQFFAFIMFSCLLETLFINWFVRNPVYEFVLFLTLFINLFVGNPIYKFVCSELCLWICLLATLFINLFVGNPLNLFVRNSVYELFVRNPVYEFNCF